MGHCKSKIAFQALPFEGFAAIFANPKRGFSLCDFPFDPPLSHLGCQMLLRIPAPQPIEEPRLPLLRRSVITRCRNSQRQMPKGKRKLPDGGQGVSPKGQVFLEKIDPIISSGPPKAKISRAGLSTEQAGMDCFLSSLRHGWGWRLMTRHSLRFHSYQPKKRGREKYFIATGKHFFLIPRLSDCPFPFQKKDQRPLQNQELLVFLNNLIC
jgi:hypothetical protein